MLFLQSKDHSSKEAPFPLSQNTIYFSTYHTLSLFCLFPLDCKLLRRKTLTVLPPLFLFLECLTFKAIFSIRHQRPLSFPGAVIMLETGEKNWVQNFCFFKIEIAMYLIQFLQDKVILCFRESSLITRAWFLWASGLWDSERLSKWSKVYNELPPKPVLFPLHHAIHTGLPAIDYRCLISSSIK